MPVNWNTCWDGRRELLLPAGLGVLRARAALGEGIAARHFAQRGASGRGRGGGGGRAEVVGPPPVWGSCARERHSARVLLRGISRSGARACAVAVAASACG